MGLLLMSTLAHSLAGGQVWTHSGQPAQVIELFTSQGCSSCPPADKYLSKLTHDPKLWVDTIPIAYHVDYWNYLGWKDPFSQPQFSQLQRLYRAYDIVGSVYTPSFVVDGKEWRGFFNWLNRTLPKNDQLASDQLTLTRNETTFTLSFESNELLDATIVFISHPHSQKIPAGENKGKTLTYNFVALDRQQSRSKEGKWVFKWEGQLTDVAFVAAWISKPGSFEKLQTVGGVIE
ncbi:DUF1223 domain-containing protein [Vibrio sonorensis]|uniref:DUF1223 domain-containing protein n=1 Tax=Vibrio sonorensis TaxID=1004316 RepID=UPI0008DAEE40|nr:DUF1223 domain-containing protein [Vibrio sonorensis]